MPLLHYCREPYPQPFGKQAGGHGSSHISQERGVSHDLPRVT